MEIAHAHKEKKKVKLPKYKCHERTNLQVRTEVNQKFKDKKQGNITLKR